MATAFYLGVKDPRSLLRDPGLLVLIGCAPPRAVTTGRSVTAVTEGLAPHRLLGLGACTASPSWPGSVA